MIIDLDKLSEKELKEQFTGLVHEESAQGASTLEMEFAGGAAPEGVAYMEPVVLMRAGKARFCGRITSVSMTNDGGERRISAVATDYWHLFEHLSAGVQLAQLKEDAVASGKMLSRTLSNALKSWDSVAQNVQLTAQNWTCTDDGTLESSGWIRLNVGKALYGMTPTVSRNRIFTTREIFTMLEEANPDCIFIAHPSGMLEVRSISLCPTRLISTRSIIAASDIAPMRDQDIDGVCVAVTCLAAKKKVFSAIYPLGTPLESGNVVFFTAEVEHDPTDQLAHMLEQAKGWYRAANTRQWSGSLTMRPNDFTDSPLGDRINITGDGAPADWESMLAVVTDVTWDFVANRVELSLGKTISPPTLHEIEFDDANKDGGGGGAENESFFTNISTPYYSRSHSQSQGSQSVPPEHYCGCSENWTSLAEYLEEIAKQFDYNDYTFPRWEPPNTDTDMEEQQGG